MGPPRANQHPAGSSRTRGSENRGETANLAHVASPAARRNPDSKSSRCSGFGREPTLDGATGLRAHTRTPDSIQWRRHTREWQVTWTTNDIWWTNC
jgi:hypothetical protein